LLGRVRGGCTRRECSGEQGTYDPGDLHGFLLSF